jgi:chemotaxis-related protein WspB
MLYLLFQIGNDRYALEARQAVEVIPLLALKRIPQAPRGVAGIFNYRGQPAPALDLCELTLNRQARERFSTRIIVVNYSDSSGYTRRLGLIAEHATQMMRRDERDFVDSGVNVGEAPYLGPVVMEEKGIIQLLHASRLAGLAEKAVPSIRCEVSGPAAPHLAPGASQLSHERH